MTDDAALSRTTRAAYSGRALVALGVGVVGVHLVVVLPGLMVIVPMGL